MLILESTYQFLPRKQNKTFNPDGILIEITLPLYGRQENMPSEPSAIERLINPKPQMLFLEIYCFIWGKTMPPIGSSPVKH